ncbi:hypothetical protein CANTEDRAFT_101726 [Yamadazyma tenuis ATCC 10573]|uniref:ATP-dependent DNA helicase CHL1 n=2 Tax=Candida tenuis TaxID=2315449 RepID=G3AYI8_CANTC|nr:uncharacterized protein CANTEDRAFT_101726 [Yamadazyma tenuis ATCC 10573]EGV65861.1 hypothetical protein CANTEDRAFT_101726 [Yamadazyma tenuis ATCC 10573]
MTRGDDKFHHPYEPYDIQLQLMGEIYEAIDKGFKVGLFESPTGTGKTLSLICATMSWLRKHKNTNLTTSHSGDSESESEPEWVKTAYKKKVLSRHQGERKEFEMHLEEASQEYEKKIAKVHELPEKRLKTSYEDDYIPADYHSDIEGTDHNEQLKDEISRLLKRVDDGPSNRIDMGTLEDDSTKIFFSSRTHTQLGQFSGQLALTTFESSLYDMSERVKYLPMGSRKQLCIHPKISKLSNTESINEACGELAKKESKCEFVCNTKVEGIKQQFNDYSLTKIHDIQELKQLGEYLKICPYYSVRNNLKMTEVISLPYQMLLEENARDSLNINIKNSIIIVDEAHNLLDTINALNSAAISAEELTSLNQSLKLYFNKFIKRLNPGNRINIMKLIKICSILHKFIVYNRDNKLAKTGGKIKINDIFIDNTGDLFNIHKLNEYLKTSKIAFKIETYLEKNVENYQTTSNPLLFKLVTFLRALSNPTNEGSFFWDSTSPDDLSIKYLLLDPSEIFKPIVEDCKCLILAGGTMEPMSDYTEYLFPYLPTTQIKQFSCDHIIPIENLKVLPIGSYKNQILDFSFKNRNNSTLILRLGECLIEIMKNTPDGTVVFLPSYKYLNHIVAEWKQMGIWKQMEALKSSLFVEPSSSSQVDEVLKKYSRAIKTGKGAVLFSVVGGKLSEGINFSDELARAVIMVGLPYPNLMSGELIARKKFIEETTFLKTGSKSMALDNSRQFIENICMRSINQSIGRSIRHINDYSMIYLFDHRYHQKSVQNKLSGWIKRRILDQLPFPEVIQHTNDFFMTKSLKKLT